MKEIDRLFCACMHVVFHVFTLHFVFKVSGFVRLSCFENACRW